MKKLLYGFVVLFLSIAAFARTVPAHSQSAAAEVILLDKDGDPITSLIDGNQVMLKIELVAAEDVEARVDFLLAGVDTPVAACKVHAGARGCRSDSFPSLGWYWNPDGSAQPQREIRAQVNGQQVGGSLNVSVIPRPAVLVHGFNADWKTWTNYLGPQGYLASIGLRGYAVGDGQVAGEMDTGSLSDPARRTNTIAQNAAILGEYIDNVQKVTEAERVDLVVHSMGGMISRYYIDRLMTDSDVAQLIILGTPMAGSSCANLPAALGILLPATLEIQPSYMAGIFNQQVFRRHGVPFHALAGTKLLDAVQSPCTPVPSDVVVTVESVKAIPMPVAEIPLLHTELNTSPKVFEDFVRSLLQTSPGKFERSPDPPAGSVEPASLQFTKVYTGHLNAGETQDVAINIDPNVRVANFALYDTSRSLEISVRGASGNVIQLDPQINGLIRVDDPSTLVYLGYGFREPRPGRWVVTLGTTERTPQPGADYAITAQFTGGAALTAKTDSLLPRMGEPVTVTAELTVGGLAVSLASAQVKLIKPDGSVQNLDMNIPAGAASQNIVINGNRAALAIRPDQPGIYGAEVSITAKTPDGFEVDRSAFLTFEAQPAKGIIVVNRLLVLGGLALLVVAIWMVIAGRRRRRSRME